MVTEGECSVSVQSHRQLLLQTGWLYAWRWKSPGSCPTHYWFSSCPRWKCLWNFKDASGAFNPLRAAVLFWDRHSWARAVIAKMGLIVYFPCDCMNLHSSQIWCELRCLRNTALSAVFYYYTTITLLCEVAGWGQALSPCVLQLQQPQPFTNFLFQTAGRLAPRPSLLRPAWSTFMDVRECLIYALESQFICDVSEVFTVCMLYVRRFWCLR